jgi:hypothetical protein
VTTDKRVPVEGPERRTAMNCRDPANNVDGSVIHCGNGTPDKTVSDSTRCPPPLDRPFIRGVYKARLRFWGYGRSFGNV